MKRSQLQAVRAGWAVFFALTVFVFTNMASKLIGAAAAGFHVYRFLAESAESQP